MRCLLGLLLLVTLLSLVNGYCQELSRTECETTGHHLHCGVSGWKVACLYNQHCTCVNSASCYSDSDCGSHAGICPDGGEYGCHRVEFVHGYCGCLYRETTLRARSAPKESQDQVKIEAEFQKYEWSSAKHNAVHDIIDTIEEKDIWFSEKNNEVLEVIDTIDQYDMVWMDKNAQDIIDTINHQDITWSVNEGGQDVIDRIDKKDIRFE